MQNRKALLLAKQNSKNMIYEEGMTPRTARMSGGSGRPRESRRASRRATIIELKSFFAEGESLKAINSYEEQLEDFENI